MVNTPFLKFNMKKLQKVTINKAFPVSLCEVMDVNIVGIILQYMYVLNIYVAHLKLMQLYVNFISTQLEEKKRLFPI